MFRAIFSGAGELGIYPVISLIMFLTIFVFVLLWMFTIKRSYLKHMSELPLDNTNEQEGR
ncbi:MAG: CcoQ/FixQ family Cbb3-type cytochrome c oxidase assembly chaperone [Candidatus Marinimicrobia bacterium]|nr:CcoQ/FixQ family Cbb3-type cytochrome c oxidase assembly chaperone [Candidatus Neomarinimicrobiota bacterium]